MDAPDSRDAARPRGGKTRHLIAKGSKGVDVDCWWQGQGYGQQDSCYQQCQSNYQQCWQGQQGCGVSLGYTPFQKGKQGFGKPQPYQQWQSPCTYVPCGTDHQAWNFQCPPPTTWGKYGKPSSGKPY